MPKTKTSFEPNNQANLVHGGAAGVKSLQHNEPLRGMALEAAHQVESDLADKGPAGMARQDAIRLEAVASCYYNAILGCSDMEQLTSLVKVWGWVQNSAIRAWQYVAQQERDANKGVAVSDVLEAIRTVQDEQNKND